jgi:hypothetical protein
MTMTLIDFGPVTASVARTLGISYEGCEGRGTLMCQLCSLAEACAKECAYSCEKCDVRDDCPCGWRDPIQRLRVYLRWLAVH